MSKMVEVVIDSVRVSLTNQQRIIILRDVNQERYLPIWIGAYEAEAITISLQEIELARPQTHDLLKNILTNLDARLLRVEVISLQDDVFYGNLVVESNGNIVNIDSRPSDALALAVRAHVPVLVSEDILEKAGIVPEDEIDNEGEEEHQAPRRSEAPHSSEDRLSVFEDFLDNLDLGQDEDDLSEDMDDDDEGDYGDLNPG